MGSFSWLRAEHTTKRANLTIGDNYKILVPKEFGGGYIKDTYFDYGQVFIDETYFTSLNKKRCKGEYVDANGNHHPASEFINSSKKSDIMYNTQSYCDLYGILAWWNDAKIYDDGEHKDLKFFGSSKPITMYDILKRGFTWLQDNRCAGIHIGCYTEQIDKLKYPLKLVSASYRGTYEDCKEKSYGDPNQGFGKYYWEDY